LKMSLRRGRTRVVLGLFLLWIGYLCLWSSKWWYMTGVG
jgi:hypothetical protein